MTGRAAIFLAIISLAASAEAILWAVANGQFRGWQHARFLPLRQPAAPAPAPRPRATRAYLAGIAIVGLLWAWTIYVLLRLALARG